MKMDIACPAELLSVELADYGANRRQAYLTFLNESPFVITALSGRISLLDSQGRLLEETRVAFGDINAPPGGRFTCHMAVDEFPDVDGITMIIEDILFHGEEPWALHPPRLKEYTPPVVDDEQARRALIAVAGSDAICYPEDQENVWLCVCGRYNRRRWTTCRRCERDRDQTLTAFTPERVEAAYAARLRRSKDQPPRVLVDGTARKRERVARAEPERPERSFGILSQWYVLVIGLALAALLFWGGSSLLNRIPQQTVSVGDGYTEMIVSDYLEPVR